jgi:hypothetical protein
MKIAVPLILPGVFFVLFNGGIHPLLVYFLAPFLSQNLVPLKVHLEKSLKVKRPQLHQLLEHFDVVEDGDFIETEVEILNLDQLSHLVGDLGYEIMAEVDELEGREEVDVLDFGNFIMGEIDDLQIED